MTAVLERMHLTVVREIDRRDSMTAAAEILSDAGRRKGKAGEDGALNGSIEGSGTLNYPETPFISTKKSMA